MRVLFFCRYTVIGLILTFTSCQKDDDKSVNNSIETNCPHSINIGDYKTIETSHEFIPYNDTMRIIVFSDSTGNEIVGNITSDLTRFDTGRLQGDYLCEEDTTKTFYYIGRQESRKIRIDIEEINVSLLLNLYAGVHIRDKIGVTIVDSIFFTDYLNISLKPIDGDLTFSSLQLVVNPRNNPNEMMSTPNFDIYTIHGVDFYDEYENKSIIPEDQFKILYNIEKGIIGLENYDKSISLKYEYVE